MPTPDFTSRPAPQSEPPIAIVRYLMNSPDPAADPESPVARWAESAIAGLGDAALENLRQQIDEVYLKGHARRPEQLYKSMPHFAAQVRRAGAPDVTDKMVEYLLANPYRGPQGPTRDTILAVAVALGLPTRAVEYAEFGTAKRDAIVRAVLPPARDLFTQQVGGCPALPFVEDDATPLPRRFSDLLDGLGMPPPGTFDNLARFNAYVDGLGAGDDPPPHPERFYAALYAMVRTTVPRYTARLLRVGEDWARMGDRRGVELVREVRCRQAALEHVCQAAASTDPPKGGSKFLNKNWVNEVYSTAAMALFRRRRLRPNDRTMLLLLLKAPGVSVETIYHGRVGAGYLAWHHAGVGRLADALMTTRADAAHRPSR